MSANLTINSHNKKVTLSLTWEIILMVKLSQFILKARELTFNKLKIHAKNNQIKQSKFNKCNKLSLSNFKSSSNRSPS